MQGEVALKQGDSDSPTKDDWLPLRKASCHGSRREQIALHHVPWRCTPSRIASKPRPITYDKPLALGPNPIGALKGSLEGSEHMVVPEVRDSMPAHPANSRNRRTTAEHQPSLCLEVIRPRVRLGDGVPIGPGRLELLRAIAECPRPIPSASRPW